MASVLLNVLALVERPGCACETQSAGETKPRIRADRQETLPLKEVEKYGIRPTSKDDKDNSTAGDCMIRKPCKYQDGVVQAGLVTANECLPPATDYMPASVGMSTSSAAACNMS